MRMRAVLPVSAGVLSGVPGLSEFPGSQNIKADAAIRTAGNKSGLNFRAKLYISLSLKCRSRFTSDFRDYIQLRERVSSKNFGEFKKGALYSSFPRGVFTAAVPGGLG